MFIFTKTLVILFILTIIKKYWITKYVKFENILIF